MGIKSRILHLDGDARSVREENGDQRFQDDAFAEVATDGRETEFAGDGCREDVRVGQAVVQEADEAVPGVQEAGVREEGIRLQDREEKAASLGEEIDVEGEEIVPRSVPDALLNGPARRIRRHVRMRVASAEQFPVDGDGGHFRVRQPEPVVDVVDVAGVPLQHPLIAEKGLQRIQDGRPPGHPDFQVVTEEGDIRPVHLLLHGEEGSYLHIFTHLRHPSRIRGIPDGRVRFELDHSRFLFFAKFGNGKGKDGMIASLAMSDFLQGLQTF